MKDIFLNFWFVIVFHANLLFAGKARSLSVEKGSMVKSSVK